MDFKDLKQLISLMNENELVEMEIEEEGRKIRLKKAGAHGAAMMAPAMPMVAPAAISGAPGQAPHPQTETVHRAPNTREITSPMVGTFYRAASPDTDPYVEIGDEFGTESTVCIIEAMKVMNEIKAEMEGEIVDILVENGEAVEYGQALFVIKPA